MKKLITLFLIFISIISFSQNPLLLKDVVPGNNTGTIQQIVKTSNYTFFNENDGGASTDRSLYRTDGTAVGTIKLNLSYPGYISTKADKLTALGNKVIFAGDNIAFYGEIWSSDGTQPGTVALERFQPISNRIPVVEISAMGSYAYYSVINKDAGGINRAYLKRTDGTAAGTSLIYDFSSFTGVPEVVFLTPVNNILYFIVYDAGGTGVDQLWRSDGTNAGTYMVYNFTTANFVESYIMPAGNNMYIMIGSVVGGVRQNTIWKSDGSAAGTIPVKFVGTGNTNLYPAFAPIGSTLYFAGADGNGKELWKTDGTAAGTLMVADINSGGGNSVPSFLTAFNNNLFFAAENPTYGGELWKYDGSVATLVKDINPGNAASVPQGFVVSGNSLIFSALNNTSGRELWITDGTSANTVMIADINPGANSSSPNFFTPGNTVYFAANNGINGFEVFKYDNNSDAIGGPNRFYVNDNSTTGDLLTLGIGNNSNNGSKLYPFATISYAVTQATEGDTIYVDAGTYAEQITIDKGLTIIGAGQDLTSIANPASALVPAPGPFAESGLIQTTQGIGDVHISNITATNNPSGNGHTIMIQSGGSVKFCKLVNGGQGVFFRVESAVKTARVEYNTIQPAFIGINCQGSGLTTIIQNNNITSASQFYSAVFAGLDFGPLPQLTIANNNINNYGLSNGMALLVSSYNGNYNNNSIVGTGMAIERYSGSGSTPNAACNWYGTSDQYAVAAKMNGNINFSPWLVNGTDNDPAIGFQPVPGSCAGKQLFFVNDNSLTGDIYTTAVGNNANNGSASGPLATITAALTKIQAGDLIIVDAGSYTEIVNVTKNVTILGAGKGVTILNGPAGPVTQLPNTGETGIIQTVPGVTDVIIENLTVDGTVCDEQHGIFIQGGGRVSNCELRYVNDGFYFQLISTQPRTAIGNNNYVHHINYVGFLFAGKGLSGTAVNNVIDLNGAIYGIGGIAGYGGDGVVASFTASNNSIINFNGFGIMVGSTQTAQIHNNSITRLTGNFFQNVHTVNVDATCNWFGTTDAAVIIPNMTGDVTYSPWLTSGTDNDVAFGFQPLSNVCNGRQNKFYVNDTREPLQDVFTTAAGNDANSGIPFAPLLTINAALAKCQNGDTVFVDHGVYSSNVNITLDKSITLLGINYQVNPNDPINPLEPNPLRLDETIVENHTFIIGASNIRIKGFFFEPNNKTQIQQTIATNDFDNIEIEKNVFSSTSNNTVINITGKQVFPLVTLNYTITENRFEKTFGSSGTSVALNAIDQAAITNNTFTTLPSATARAQTGINIGQSYRMDNVTISNNNVYSHNTFVLGGNSKRLTITGNKTQENERFMGINILNSDPSETTVSDNIVTNDKTFATSFSYVRTNGTDVSAPNIFRAERNTITIDGTGLAFTPQALIAPTVINSPNTELSIVENKLRYTGDFSSRISGPLFKPAIRLWQSPKNAIVSRNEIVFDGINYGNVPVDTLVGILLYHSTLPAGASFNFTNNKVSGYTYSIAVVENGTNLYGKLPVGVTVNVNNNSLTNAVMAINNGTTSQEVNATCNWYGSSAEQDVLNKVTSTVQQIPWLTNGTDNDVAVGFQPVAGACNGNPRKLYVNNNSQTGDVFTSAIGSNANPGTQVAPFATLDFALSVAKAGDSIYVDAGTYAMTDYTINKGVTILGSNYNQSPNNPADKLQINPTRNAESIISGATATLASNDISLQGLMFDPGLKPAISLNNSVGSNNNYGNFSLQKNRFRVVQTSSQVILVGVGVTAASPAPVGVGGLVNTGFTITDNRFEKSAAGAGAIFSIHLVKNVTIDNNSFVLGVGGAIRTAIALSFGVVGVVDNVSVTNNTVDRFASFVTGNQIANGIVTGNRVINTSNAFNITNTMAGSATIEFSNNILDGSNGIMPFTQYNRQGGSNAGASSLFKAENNTISVTAVPGTTTLLGAFNVTYFNGVLNSSAIIRGNTMTFSGNLSSVEGQFIRPIFFRGNLQQVSIDHNEITLNGTSLLPRNPANPLPVCPAISMYSDNGVSSVMPAGAVINILNNKIHGFKHSFVIFDPQAGSDAYTGFGNLQPGISVNVHENSFTGDSICINNGSVGGSINASCNWYGYAAIQELVGRFSTDLNNIYTPYLTNGTDNDVATGFQPVPGSCNGQSVQARLDSYTNVTCNGANNGTASVTVFNGVAPYIFAWTKDGDPLFSSTVEDPTNFGPGVYHLSITDALGTNIILNENEDIITIDVTITEPPLLTANTGGTNVSCFGGSNGSANVTAGGGTVPYTYLWSNGSTNASISNLSAGIYSVTVTDGNGCTKSASYQVTQPALLTAIASGTSTSCANTATVVASGGTLPYSYAWSNGATTQSISSIPAGTYTVIVTDNKGCTASSSVTVTATEAFNPSASVTNVLCFGGSTGSITVTNANGVAPFQYSKNGIDFQNSNVFNGLAAGPYTITVKDVNGCTGFVEKTVMQPTQLVVTLGIVQNTCSGLSTGSISVTVGGGSPSYTYKWSGPNSYSSTQLNISGLAAGNYSLTVTDSKGCTFVLPATVSPYPAINITESITNVLCSGSATGSIDVTVTGGTRSGFTYLWNNGATTQDRVNLAAGSNYKVTITDISSGCTVQKTYAINQPSSAVGITVSNPSIINVSGCNTLGSFTAQGSGGTQYPVPDPYRYSINGAPYQTSPVFNNLQAGSYTVTVKDLNGCMATKAVTISDNGSDEYESAPNNTGNNNNNSRGKAAPIGLGTAVSARIGIAGDLDFYQLGSANLWTGNYTITFVQPATAVVFDLVASNGTTVLTPTSSSSTYKQYNGLNGAYFVRVSGANSFSCYQLTVTSGLITRSSGSNAQQEVTKASMKDGMFDIKVLGNPSSTSFIMNVITNSEEKISMRVFNAQGRLIEERQGLQPMETLRMGERYINGVYMAEIRQGKKSKTVRLVKM